METQNKILLSASAGCGKTYQLSNRFVNLVAGGASPHRILTVTFTRKAAAEMKERILADAYKLLSGQLKISGKRSPEETAHAILSKSQSLKIMTMDSLFYEWASRFSFESNLKGSKLADEAAIEKCYIAAWQVFSTFMNDDTASFQDILSETGVLKLQSRMQELRRFQNFIWAKDPFKKIPVPDTHNIFRDFNSELSLICERVNEKLSQELKVIIEVKDFNALLASPLFTKTNDLSGRYLRGSKREGLDDFTHAIKDTINAQKIKDLNAYGSLFYSLHNAYQECVSKEKDDLLEFNDLLKACYHLFNNPDASGARYLISQGIEHLLIDEFQDTSFLQWEIFSFIAEELTSGCGIYNGSVFLVGDKKQSIYGFREADPKIMDEPENYETIPLNKTYRSTTQICEYINEYFFRKNPMNDFITHSSALGYSNNSMVMVSDLVEGGEENEARLIAETILKYGISPNECALLFRKSTHAAVYETTLKEYGIPCTSAGGFFENPIVSDLWAYLKICAYPNDIQSRYQVLKSPFYSLSDAEIMATLDKFPEVLLPLRALNPRKILADLFERYEITNQNAYLFYDLCENANLHECLEELREMSTRELKSKSDTNAVELMTIHKSKGLEWPFVILVDAGSKWEQKDRYWLKSDDLYYIGTKDEQPHGDPFFETLSERHTKNLEEESQRLLYVALTRAKNHLLITGSKGDMSPFIPEDCKETTIHGTRIYYKGDYVASPKKSKEKKIFQLNKKPSRLRYKSIVPSKVDESEIKSGSRKDQKDLGITLHKDMESFIKNGTCHHRITKSFIQSECWNKIKRSSYRIQSEFEFTHLQGQNFIQGVIDLLAFKENGDIWVVDFKTGNQDLESYRFQISTYCQAVRKIHPNSKVNGYIAHLEKQELSIIE